MMKKLFKTSTSILIALITLTAFTTVVHADEATRSEVVCTQGAYGQSNCTTRTVVIQPHVPVAAGVPSALLTGLFALSTLGAATAFTIQKRIK